MTTTPARLAALGATAALVLAACGGGDEPVPAADGTAAEAVAAELPEPAPGPVPDLPVAPTSADSPLPVVAVRQINGEGGWVQFADLLPSDNPLLVWFWAPH